MPYIARFYVYKESGNVAYDEIFLREISPEVDDGEIDKDRLKRAAEIANFYDYIMGLPLKFNTKIGRDGVVQISL